MRFSPCTGPGRHAVWAVAATVALAALGFTFSAPAALAQPAAPAAGDPAPTDPVSPGDQAAGDPDEPLTFLDSVTVTATLRPAPVRDTPGMVSVIDDVAIEERLVQNMADLVKYEPGVYVENNVTRLGLNGFNIRGIGGNRVMTQVDGVQTSEQFDFGPFNVHQVSLDIDTLKSVEIVRSANSALYGSDALGGVVSLFTKDPGDYLRGRRFHAGAKTTWDGRADGLSGNLSLAAGTERFQASLFASATRGNEIRNKGTVETNDDTRTVPNPQDLVGSQMLAKIVFNASPGNMLRASAEVYDTRVETAVLSQQGSAQFSPTFRIDTTDYDAVDTQERLRLSIDHTLVDRGGFDQLSWRIYGQRNDTSQVVDDARTTFGFGPPMGSLRHGTVDFDQAGYGTSAQGQKWLGDPEGGVLFSFGATYKTDHFDVLRDAREVNARSGAVIPSRLIYPTKYFPESDVAEAGAYLQGEIQLGRVTLVPGVRYDHFTLDADQADSVFLASLNPVPADFSADAVSPKFGIAARLSDIVTVHAQYAGGFRAPPYSNINTGFTNFRGGYTTLPNAALRAETSDNVEVGIRSAFARASFDLTTFLNYYDDFIELSEPRLQSPHAAARVPEPEPRAGGDQGGRDARRGLPQRQRDAARKLRPHPRHRHLEGRNGGAAGAGDPARIRRPERGRPRSALRPALRSLGRRDLLPDGRVVPAGRDRRGRGGSVLAGRVRHRRPHRVRLAHGGPHVPARPAEPDRRQVLRVVERAGAAGGRPGHRPLLEPRNQPGRLTGVRLVATRRRREPDLAPAASGQSAATCRTMKHAPRRPPACAVPPPGAVPAGCLVRLAAVVVGPDPPAA